MWFQLSVTSHGHGVDIFWNNTRSTSLYQLIIYQIFYLTIHLQVPEIKDLVIDPQLMKPLDHFTGASFLKVTIRSFELSTLHVGVIMLFSSG